MIPLQSKDVVRSLRLASRTLADVELTGAFWASRFREGHEYRYAFKFRQSTLRSWGAMYDAIVLKKTHPVMINQKRIWDSTLRLGEVFRQMIEPCHGCPLRSPFEPLGEEDGVEWRIARRGLNRSRNSFNNGSRAFHIRTIEIPVDLHGIFVSFIDAGNGPLISGLRFERMSGDSVRIDYTNGDREVCLDVNPGQKLRG